jgi:IS30 family transposase
MGGSAANVRSTSIVVKNSEIERPRRLRRWLPRHLDIDRTPDREIQEIVLTTNLTPRKCLGFKTPFKALLAELGKEVQIRFS